MTNEEFLIRANLTHNNTYIYISEYKGSKKYVDIICKTHGVFSQRADIHIKGSGCSKCSKRLTNEEFIIKANFIHNSRYMYIDKYELSHIPIKILCKEHGVFSQKPNDHLSNKCGCPKCAILDRKLTNKEFINICNNIHKFKYKYIEEYEGYLDKITILCEEHGEFTQRADTHMNGSGCPKCSGVSRYNNISYVEKANLIHNHRYNYSKINYINSMTKIIIICNEHGDFTQTPNKHLIGRGCPKCGNKFGILEKKWLDSLNINNRQVKIGKYIVDGLDNDIIYEFNGDFWHGNPKKYNKDDINSVNGFTFGELYNKTLDKENYLKSIGYKVISIWESDFTK